MAKNLAAVISKAEGEFELVEREIPQPGAGEIRIKVEACGVCHSDVIVKRGAFPWLKYPLVAGHEVVGYVDEVGSGVTEWKKGDHVGVGWHGGHCFVCDRCRRGDFLTCVNQAITGITRDGGYQQYMLARHEAVALLPEGMDPAEGGPLMCAGVTTFNSLRHSGAVAGDLVGVLGIGDWDIWGFSMRQRPDTARWRSDVDPRMRRSRKSWARLHTSTPKLRMARKS